MYEISRCSYESSHTEYFMDKMDEVIRWLESKGLKATQSRYAKYKDYIDDFYKKGNREDLADLEQRFKKLNDAVQECIQIVQVFNSFKNEKSIGFEERLQKAVYGTDFYNPENKIDQPRDFLYELLIASWFNRLGYEIDFEQLTDVVANRNGTTIYIECKRIKSINRLEENLKKACKQLSKINNDANHYGLIFIDIYNCVADKIRDYEYSDIPTMIEEVKDVLKNNFIDPSSGLIEKILTRNLENTLGVVFTSVRCLWLANVTPQFYQKYEVMVSSKISDDAFKVLQKLLRNH